MGNIVAVLFIGTNSIGLSSHLLAEFIVCTHIQSTGMTGWILFREKCYCEMEYLF